MSTSSFGAFLRFSFFGFAAAAVEAAGSAVTWSSSACKRRSKSIVRNIALVREKKNLV